MTFAQTTAVEIPAKSYHFSWTLLEWLDGRPGLSLGLLIAVVALVVLNAWLYQRERAALPGVIFALLVLLRLVAIAGVVVMLLGPQRQHEEEVVRPSQVVVLLDDSLSMAMANQEALSSEPATPRWRAAQQLLFDEKLAEQLAQTHEVAMAGTSDAGRRELLPASATRDTPPASEGSDQQVAAQRQAPPADAESGFRPASTETRLGDALQAISSAYSGEPLAGIVLLTDGRQNAGVAPADVAAEVGVPVMTIGFGPLQADPNVIVRDLVAPSRAYPNDEIELTAIVEQTGGVVSGTTVSLYRRLESENPSAEVLLDSQRLTWTDATTPVSISFKTQPDKPGQYRYSVKAAPIPAERQEDDNTHGATVEVVDRVTRVLLWAGGPSRDYRFLRNQLQRDDAFHVDVRLQSASRSASQDARKVLSGFPENLQELEEYDAVVAIDPAWSTLGEDQVQAMDQWIARRGGGLYYAPGPVNAPKWLQRSPARSILDWLPVELPDRLGMLSAPSSGALQARPVQLTRAGTEAGFLAIAGGRELSRDAWRVFPGFYRVNAQTAVRAGGTVLAQVDGDAGQPRVVFAEQFYGSGRVFYSGTTELWRLRKQDPKFFAAMTTKLLRRISQGRLLSNSPAGSLLFERERYDLGTTMVLRAVLPRTERAVASAEIKPLKADLIDPAGTAITIQLKASKSQRDTWIAPVLADQEGTYEAVLSPHVDLLQTSLDMAPSRLSARATVTVPQLERIHVTRDVAELRAIAAASGGHYYATSDVVLQGDADLPPLAQAIPSREETQTLLGQVDQHFAKQVSQLLLGVICGAMLLEWLIRRLARLA